jgi:hypothetical protein
MYSGLDLGHCRRGDVQQECTALTHCVRHYYPPADNLISQNPRKRWQGRVLAWNRLTRSLALAIDGLRSISRSRRVHSGDPRTKNATGSRCSPTMMSTTSKPCFHETSYNDYCLSSACWVSVSPNLQSPGPEGSDGSSRPRITAQVGRRCGLRIPTNFSIYQRLCCDPAAPGSDA